MFEIPPKVLAQRIKLASRHPTASMTPEEIMVFMICNWRIPYVENLRKLDLLKVWGVKVADCYYDNQVGPQFIPLHWTLDQIYDFRRKCRKHNQLIRFKRDPQPSINQHLHSPVLKANEAKDNKP